MWIIEWLLDNIFNLVQKITAENSMHIGVAVIIALGYFGVFLNIYVLACIFLLNIGFIYLSKHKSYSFYSKYKNKSVQNFNLAYESAHEVFFLLFMFVDFIGLPKLFLFRFSCLTI